ncbi:MAG TPA: DUF5808 domain-containing protein [Streptosporangiaceae bacterium]
MSTGNLAVDVADFTVPLFGTLMCVAPMATRPTVQFGVRVPRERTGAPVIRRERRSYYWRTAAIGVCCTVVAVAVRGYGSWWLPRIIQLSELAADFGCFWVARRKIAAVKNADEWFAGLRQTVVTDTSWRADPPCFPVRWLIPALAVMAATAAVGALRYPGLPAHILTSSDRRVPKSVVSAFAVVAGQLYVTALWSGLMLIIYRSRPEIEVADAAASTLRYRRFLAAFTRAVLILVALVDATLLLVALHDWQVYRLSGTGWILPVLPFAAGMLLLTAVTLRAGQGGWRLNGNVRSLVLATGTDRDDDRFWKAGLLYVNRDDPAIMVGARFGVGWTLNFGNPSAWLIIAGIVAAPTGLAMIGAAAGM